MFNGSLLANVSGPIHVSDCSGDLWQLLFIVTDLASTDVNRSLRHFLAIPCKWVCVSSCT